MTSGSDLESTQTPAATSSGVDGQARMQSYGIGIFLCLVGVGMLAGFFFTQQAPAKLFNLLAAGGVAALLSGIGLFIHPLDGERLNAFQNEPNPIAMFGVMPPFWKAWLLVILAAMGGAFVYVTQHTVRVGWPDQARIFSTTLPSTSVSRKSRPW
jgi:hypothetical protein